MKGRTNRSPVREADVFNARFAVGTDVLYTPYPGAEPVRDRIYAPAEVLGGHTAVAWLAGQRGCVACHAVTPVQGAAQ